MYESFFGFKEKPFNITPDPKYLYLSEQHEEAIAHLLYGIQERGGFVVITGEIGTGKTMLCRHLINQMDERTEGAMIFNPNLSEIELLKSINEDFGIASTGNTRKELIDELNRFLLEERLRGKNMVLMIDEAQNLLPAVMEQVRMLSNLETEKEKLIQIILIGQPQLKKLLARPELRQLDQRVTARYHLKQLRRKETYNYIQHRLDVASNGNSIHFEPGALRAIYRYSNGVPRLINVVCDRALLGAFTAGKQSPISRKIVKQAIKEVTGSTHFLRDRISLDSTAVMLFVLPFLFMIALVTSWTALTAMGIIQKKPEYVYIRGAEMIPDSPKKPVEKTSYVMQPLEAVAEPAASEPIREEPALALAESTDIYTNEIAASKPVARLTQDSRKEKEELIGLLLSEDYRRSRFSAARNLLSLWGKSSALTVEESESFYLLALSRQMRCTELWTNLEGLRVYNSPCLLEMFIPQQMKPRYAVLMELRSDTARILYGDGSSLELSLQVLDEFWLRRAFIFWKDFEQPNEILQPGDSGGQVVWLQAALQSLGFYGYDLTGIFNDSTEEAVRSFQREKQLLIDGIVGPRTRLVLYAQLERYNMPRLNRGNL